MTIQLQTSGISFMQPRVGGLRSELQLLGEAQSTSDLGDVVSVHLPNVNPFERYYIEVDSPAQNVFGIGRYALSVTFNGRSLVNPASLPAILARAVRLPERGGPRGAPRAIRWTCSSTATCTRTTRS